jgi:hypothetical protein
VRAPTSLAVRYSAILITQQSTVNKTIGVALKQFPLVLKWFSQQEKALRVPQRAV